MLIPCSLCQKEWNRPFNSQHMEAPYVCKICRCMDCQIVLDVECDWGERHGQRSAEDSRVCVACIAIRERVASMDSESLRIRSSEFLIEHPLYE